ncbi:MAG: substrate-binding domain-containing protein [Oscillospiraceae bacterium]|nr:substrate-binding domain-containing protein [Oscillospiraceae bacterium]
MKKISTLLIVASMLLTFAACSGEDNETPTDGGTQEQGGQDSNNNHEDNGNANNGGGTEELEPITGAIQVITRDPGSGTRDAFVSAFDVRDEEGDNIRDEAQVQISTGGLIGQVVANPQSIGYVSIASLDPTADFRGVAIDGVVPSAENITNGTYTAFREFNIFVIEDELSEPAQDFIDFILSNEGQAIAEDIVGVRSPDATGEDYAGGGLGGSLSIDGSSSIESLMRGLVEAYELLNPDMSIDFNSSSSSAGVSGATEGRVDIGMVSREFREGSDPDNLTAIPIAIDGVAVIVHADNPLQSLTTAQVREIFIHDGNYTTWEQVNP